MHAHVQTVTYTSNAHTHYTNVWSTDTYNLINPLVEVTALSPIETKHNLTINASEWEMLTASPHNIGHCLHF